MPVQSKWIVLSLLFIGSVLAYGNEQEFLYVQSAAAELKAEPKMSATKITDVKRGDRALIVDKSEKWLKVKVADKEGWLPKLFLSEHKPVGRAELAQDIPANLEKASRRRPPSYTVSAATRGLMAETPTGRKGDKMDYAAVKKLEGIKPSTSEIDSFRAQVKLKTEKP